MYGMSIIDAQLAGSSDADRLSQDGGLPIRVSVAFLQHEAPLALSIPVVMFAIEIVWYSMVIVSLSSNVPRAKYLRYKAWI